MHLLAGAVEAELRPRVSPVLTVRRRLFPRRRAALQISHRRPVVAIQHIRAVVAVWICIVISSVVRNDDMVARTGNDDSIAGGPAGVIGRTAAAQGQRGTTTQKQSCFHNFSLATSSRCSGPERASIEPSPARWLG